MAALDTAVRQVLHRVEPHLRWYDKYLQTGPYNFGFPSQPDWVEHFPYQNGLLVSYWDTTQSDNNDPSIRVRA